MLGSCYHSCNACGMPADSVYQGRRYCGPCFADLKRRGGGKHRFAMLAEGWVPCDSDAECNRYSIEEDEMDEELSEEFAGLRQIAVRELENLR